MTNLPHDAPEGDNAPPADLFRKVGHDGFAALSWRALPDPDGTGWLDREVPAFARAILPGRSPRTTTN